jgi:hypothetical protein
MSHVNSTTAPGQPDDSEARDILDIISEAVAGITDAEIEEQLRETLDRAAYNRLHALADDPGLMLLGCSDDGGNVAVLPVQSRHSIMHPWKIARNVVREAEQQLTAARATRLEAHRILGGGPGGPWPGRSRHVPRPRNWQAMAVACGAAAAVIIGVAAVAGAFSGPSGHPDGQRRGLARSRASQAARARRHRYLARRPPARGPGPL